MLGRLSSFPKVKEEINLFSATSKRIKDQKTKKIFDEYFTAYKTELRIIDESHTVTSNGFLDPKFTIDNRKNLHDLRLKMMKIITSLND